MLSRWTTIHNVCFLFGHPWQKKGPKQSRPQKVKVGVGSNLYSGRSDIFWTFDVPRKWRQVTHLKIKEVTCELQFNNQSPLDLVSLEAMERPWWATSWWWSASVKWDFIGIIIGCFTPNGFEDMLSLPPTRSSPSSFRNGSKLCSQFPFFKDFPRLMFPASSGNKWLVLFVFYRSRLV